MYVERHIMINKIEAVQPNQIYRINPVKFMGNQPKRSLSGNSFSTNSNMFFAQNNNNGYSLNHPRVAGSPTCARSIDFLA